MNKSLFSSERGAVAIIFALLLIPMIGMVGIAIDSYRAYAVNQHIQRALDAAALAGAKHIDEGDPIQVATDVFNENWNDGYMRSSAFNLDVSFNIDRGELRIDTDVSLPNIFMPILGSAPTTDFSKSAVAQRKVNSLELALAIDNTTSMLFGDGSREDQIPSAVSERRLAKVKDAAKLMLDILYDGEDEVDNMWISVVPFTNIVNIGNTNTGTLVSGSLSGLKWAPERINSGNFPSAWNTFYDTNRQWRGCVYERTGGVPGSTSFTYTGKDVTDDPPAGTDGQAFYPYNIPPKGYVIGARCAYSRVSTYVAPTTCDSSCNVVSGTGTCRWVIPYVDGKPGERYCSGTGSSGSGAYTPNPRPTTCQGVGVNNYLGSESSEYRCNIPGGGSPPACTGSACAGTCPMTTINSACYITNDSRYGKPCASLADLQSYYAGEPWNPNVCAMNYGPSRRCFGWESSTIPRYMFRWHAADNVPSEYYPTPDNVDASLPVTGMIEVVNDSNYTNSSNTGFFVYPADKRFSRVAPGGFRVRVMNDEISACGNVAAVRVSGGGGGYFCNQSYFSSERPNNVARWIAAWPNPGTAAPDTVGANTTLAGVKLGGWGNSGCGLPILPLTSRKADVLARIDEMDIPLDYNVNFNTSTNTIPNTQPATGYQGTLINQGLVWGWRTVSTKWQGFWDGIADNTLPKDLTSANGTKAVVVLSDGLNYLKRQREFKGTYYERSAIISTKTAGSTYYLPDNDYDSSAYGTMNENWLRANGNGTPLIGNENTPLEMNPPYIRELDRRLRLTCTNMRAQNIQMFFVMYAMSDHPLKGDAEATFRNCIGAAGTSNTGTHGRYYDAVTEAELRDAFKDIAASLLQLRLTE